MSIPFYVSYAVLWILIVLNSLVALGLVRLVAQLRQQAPPGENNGRADDGRLRPGQEAPAFSAVDLAGVPVRSADYAGRPWALLFVSPTCRSCMTTLAELEALAGKVQGNVLVVCRAGHKDCVRLAETDKVAVRFVADEDDELARRFRVSSNPTAILVDGENRVQKYGYPKREDLAELLDDGREAKTTAVG